MERLQAAGILKSALKKKKTGRGDLEEDKNEAEQHRGRAALKGGVSLGHETPGEDAKQMG